MSGVHEIRAQVFVHATEDKERVMKALMELFPEDVRESVTVEEEVLEGHYGNPIIKIVARVKGEHARRTLNYILSRLSNVDINAMSNTLEDRVDKEGTLYFRLSKQEAYLGSLTLYEADDVIRISVHFEGNRSKALKEYRKILGAGEL
ncbi:MAG: hypothetical protein LRS46_00970 [Desulfurococcales archaeon]|nr:hypothetical protein [Desulfurococcales archaeon]